MDIVLKGEDVAFFSGNVIFPAKDVTLKSKDTASKAADATFEGEDVTSKPIPSASKGSPVIGKAQDVTGEQRDAASKVSAVAFPAIAAASRSKNITSPAFEVTWTFCSCACINYSSYKPLPVRVRLSGLYARNFSVDEISCLA